MPTVYGKTSFPYIKQADTNDCGPSCVLMMLKYLIKNAGTYPTLKEIAQKAAISVSNAIPLTVPWTDSGWASTPYTMVNMLHAYNPPLALWINYFVYGDKITNFRNALVTKIKSLSDKDLTPPPIVPVHSNSHWVVLFQYVETNEGSFFYGNDPDYKTKKSDPLNPGAKIRSTIYVANKDKNFIPSGDNDGKSGDNNALVMIDSISANANSRMGFHPVPDLPEARIGVPPRVAPSPIILNPVLFPPVMVSPNRIPALVKEQLAAYGISAPQVAGGQLAGTVPGLPFLVKRLDRKDSDYYLIGMQNGSRQNHMLVRLDASTGEFLDSLSIPPTEYMLGKTDNDPALVAHVVNQFPAEKRSAWEIAFKEELLKPSPKLVWKPCVQTLSAFYPFYEVKSKKDVFYVGIDGAYSRYLAPYNT